MKKTCAGPGKGSHHVDRASVFCATNKADEDLSIGKKQFKIKNIPTAPPHQEYPGTRLKKPVQGSWGGPGTVDQVQHLLEWYAPREIKVSI